jgi:hypothetical protein
MISDDEYLERIVAGIHSLTTAGAEVNWNEIINGRQFDVAMRFKIGTLRYLVLIEVKNRTRKAEAADMDAFVLKAKDQNANKAVFVTAAGFQKAAIAVAKRHGVDLFTLTFDNSQINFPKNATFLALKLKEAPNVPLQLNIGEPQLVANIIKARLVYDDGNQFGVPEEQSQMNYYLKKTKLADGRTLNDLIQAAAIPDVQLGETCAEELHIIPPQYIETPDRFFFPPGIITSIKFTVVGRKGRPISGNIKVDPNLFTLPVVYTNVITEEVSRFAIDQLPLGVKRVSVGTFYFTQHPLSYYYCDAIRGETVHWYMVESFQNDELIQTQTTQNIKYSSLYIPVADKKILSRLQARLEQLKQPQQPPKS